MKIRLLPFLLLALSACATSAPDPTPQVAPAPAEAPESPRLAISETRPIEDMHRRTIGFQDSGVWISNEFEGGRVSDAWQERDGTLVVQLRPENSPINPSPWYAFKAWSDRDQTIDLRLTYENGRHRYVPKIRHTGEAWAVLDSSLIQVDSATAEPTLRLSVGPDTLWVAGQEIMTSTFFEAWTDSLSSEPHISRTIAGKSGRGRPMYMVEFGDPDATRHVMAIGRQHPPEATGSMALLAFVGELAGDSPMAQEFRESFRVHVIPLVNPDGVDLGHWRHNTGGVDLNRDWEAFLQPETRVVREAFARILDAPGHEMWFGVDFHSTQYDVIYTLERTLETDPSGITDRWLTYLGDNLPHYEVNDSPSDLGTPMSRNWFYRAFQAPALIYEVGDQTERALIHEVAVTAAQGTMRILLDELGGW
jgi:hypothetical protein